MAVTNAVKNAVRAIGKLSRRSKLQLAWDFFMVWVAIINLWMILFDLSYLWLRPQYVTYIPVVASIYDPVKGIESHPLTDALMNEITVTRSLLETDAFPATIREHRENLVEMSYRVVHENAFARSGHALQ